MVKVDVWNHENRYKNWKSELLNSKGNVLKNYIEPGLTKQNSKIFLEFIFDMEHGQNVSNRNKKGCRSYARLNTLRQRISQIMRMLQNRGINDITKIQEKEISKFFADMRRGEILTKRKEKFKSVADYVKGFKSFWRWHIKVNRKKGIIILDIVEDIDSSESEKTKFVYFEDSDLKKILPYFEKDEQLMIQFVRDSIVRTPGELRSLKVSMVSEEDGEVWIRMPAEITKTNFSRTFNLLYCGEELLRYIKRKKLSQEDFLFQYSQVVFLQKFQKVCKQVFGDKISKAGEYFKNATLYDLRHSGAIDLRIKAKENPGEISLDAIRHRAGWVDMKQLNNYTRFLGLDGKIDKQGLLIKQDKTALHNENQKLAKEIKNIKKVVAAIIETTQGDNPTQKDKDLKQAFTASLMKEK